MAIPPPPLLHDRSVQETPVGDSDQDRTRRLIDAAYDLLDESGLEGLTIRAVLAKTGLARRAFYERFQGKDDLVLAVFDESLRSAAVYFRQQISDSDTPLDALRKIVSGLVIGQLGYENAGGNLRSAALSREHLRLADARPEELQSALKPLIDLIAAIVEHGIADGSLRACDAHLQAQLVYNLVSTTVHSLLLAEEGSGPDLARREMLVDALWDFCRNAVAA